MRKYADLYEFEHLDLVDHDPRRFVEALHAAEKAAGATPACAVIDSMSHSWMGVGGTLEQVEAKKKVMKNDFMAWAEPSQEHRKLLEAILQSPIHVVCTLRSKMSYEIVEQNGKKVPVKVGMAPIHREGVEYEFDVLASMDHENVMTVHGTRCRALKGMVMKEPDERIGEIVAAWLDPERRAPDEMPQTFEIGGKRYHTNGITQPTLEALWVFKRKDPMRIAALLGEACADVLEDLTEAQGQIMVAACTTS